MCIFFLIGGGTEEVQKKLQEKIGVILKRTRLSETCSGFPVVLRQSRVKRSRIAMEFVFKIQR